MSTYFDSWGRVHDKICKEGKPSSNNGWIYTAYLQKSEHELEYDKLERCFRECKQIDPTSGLFYLTRSPHKFEPPISRDEILGMAALGLLKPRHLNGWNFSPYVVPKFNIVRLIFQVIEARNKHRNYFWNNKLDQLYRFAFSVPIQDRAFLLESFGETKSFMYLFYKSIAFIDSKFSNPKNGIHWLKYGGEERKKIMQQEFPEDHPLRQL